MHYDGTNFYCYRKVLDIEGGIKNGNKVITYYKHGGVNQQWFVNSDNIQLSVLKEIWRLTSVAEITTQGIT